MEPQQPIAPVPTPQPAPPKTGGMKKVVIAIIILVVIGAMAYLFSSGIIPLTSGETYTDPNGAYSFSYPTESTIEESNDGGLPLVKIVGKPETESAVGVLPNFIVDEFVKYPGVAKTSLGMIAGYPADQYVSETTGSGKVAYTILQTVKIPAQGIEGSYDAVYIAFSIRTYEKTPPESEMVKSLKINKSKVGTLTTTIDKYLEGTRAKAKDAAIKANLSALRPQAEIFYDQHKSSYVGICASSEAKTFFDSIKQVGSTETSCKDAKGVYSMSAKLMAPGYFCIDSMGYSTTTPTLKTGTSCK